MCRWPVRFLAPALIVISAAAADARAGISWSYDTTSSTDAILSDNGHSSIALTHQSPLMVVGSSDIVLANLNSQSTTADGHPDAISHGDYFLTLHLTDGESNVSKNLTFTGTLTGALSAHSTVTHNVFTSATTETAMLGDHTYKVTLSPYSGPGPAGGIPGSIGAHVAVEDDCHHAAEPSGLILAGLGFCCLGLIVWRRLA